MVVISLIHMASYSSVWTEPSLMFPLLAATDTCEHSPLAGTAGLAGLGGHPFGLLWASPSEATLDFATSLIPDPAEPKEQHPANMCLLNYCFCISCFSRFCDRNPEKNNLREQGFLLAPTLKLVTHGISSVRRLITLCLQMRSRERRAHTSFTFFFLVSPDPRYI